MADNEKENYNQEKYWYKEPHGFWIKWENKHLKEKVITFVDPELDDYEKLQMVRNGNFNKKA